MVITYRCAAYGNGFPRVDINKSGISVADNSRIAPDSIPEIWMRPMLYRINRKVGNPVAAVIFRTCRFLPSVNDKAIQEVGMFFRNRIGGFRSGI